MLLAQHHNTFAGQEEFAVFCAMDGEARHELALVRAHDFVPRRAAVFVLDVIDMRRYAWSKVRRAKSGAREIVGIVSADCHRLTCPGAECQLCAKADVRYHPV